ncbi:hypothetical protein [Enterococcus innesii]|uniref:hypothetical protein n=1 Tax=Enterococcus innesii TaxID=2839759 RepID=UPI003D124C30
MNEIEIEEFDYSIVDDKTASFLKLKEQEMQTIVLNNSIQLGEKLIEAQEKLARFNKGTFEKWFVSIGLKKQTVYNYINQAKFVHQMDESTQIEMFQELPTSLKTEVSKPSVKPEIAEAIMKGDVKTKKEVEELKKQLKAKDEQIEMQAKMIDDLSEQEPEIIEKEVVVEKIPDDYSFFKGNYEVTKSNYEFYKSQNEDLRNEIKNLEERIKQESSSEQETKLLQEKITALESTRFEMHEKEKSYKRVTNLSLEIENILDNHACLKYSKDFKNLSLDRQAFLELEDSIERLEQWISEIKSELPNKNIIEGELLK